MHISDASYQICRSRQRTGSCDWLQTISHITNVRCRHNFRYVAFVPFAKQPASSRRYGPVSAMDCCGVPSGRKACTSHFSCVTSEPVAVSVSLLISIMCSTWPFEALLWQTLALEAQETYVAAAIAGMMPWTRECSGRAWCEVPVPPVPQPDDVVRGR